MRTCPTCGARYAPPAQYCQTDGARLNVPSTPTDPYVNTRILEQFRLERVIGSGGMGVVYSGLDEGLGRRVAVKILHRDLITNADIVSRFHREAQIAAQLDHPGIVRVITFGQLPDKNLFLVLEFLEGPTLSEAIEKDGPFAPERAVKITASIADAIGYAHSRGIVHRDLKPENVILTRRDDDPEHPKVLDFSIAKMLIGSASFVTQSGLIFGTARYISPEGASGDSVDQRGDVYSLGVIAYHLLVGRTPFEAEEPVQLLIKHMHEAPPPMRNFPAGQRVPAALEAVVMRALSKNPAARYPDGVAFGRALRECSPDASIRSLVATTAMPLVPSDGATSTVPPSPYVPSRRPFDGPTYANGTPPAPSATASDPVDPSDRPSLQVGPGISVVRRVTRPAGAPVQPIATDRTVESLAQTSGVSPLAETDPSGASTKVVVDAAAARVSAPIAQPDAGPTARLHPRIELPAVVTPSVTREPTPPTVPSPVAPSSLAPAVLDDDDDDIVIPGLPKRRKTLAPPRPFAAGDLAGPDEITVRGPQPQPRSGLVTALVVVVSVLTTLGAAAGVAYGLRLFPSQQQADKTASLLHRASEALRTQHLVLSPNHEDVEDLTDAVLAVEPHNARALSLRRAAAVNLQAAADAARLGGHPELAVTHLQNALRLTDDPALREALAAAEQEARAARAPQPQTQPQPRPPARRPPPPRAPPLVHPPQPTTPLSAQEPPTAPGVNLPSAPAETPQEPGVFDPPGGHTGAF